MQAPSAGGGRVRVSVQASRGLVQDDPHDHDRDDAKGSDDAMGAIWLDGVASKVASGFELELPNLALVAHDAGVAVDTLETLPAQALPWWAEEEVRRAAVKVVSAH